VLSSILEALPWATITPLTTMATFTALVWSGRLVPRSWVDKATADQDARVQFLESTNAAQSATIASLTQQTHDLAVSADLSVALLRSLQNLNAHPARALDLPPPGSGASVPTSIETS
jgi:uncharacterized coiled-coil protein SlyX